MALVERKHTPGPWSYRPTGAGDYGAPDIHTFQIVENKPHGYYLATVIGDVPSSVNHEANARLIAAAPTLLSALEAAREAIASLPEDALGMNSEGVGDTPGMMHSWPIRDEMLHNIDVVIAKATVTEEAKDGTR